MVASTLVTDPLFSRGVCLMVHQDESGAIGVMLNRPIMPPPPALLEILGANLVGGEDPTAAPASSVDAPPVARPPRSSRLAPPPPVDQAAGDHLPATKASADHSPAPSPPTASLVHFGGPLSGPVVAVHNSLALAEVETGRGVYVAAQKDHLETLVREATGDYRLIIGHAAWTPQQLTAELDAGMWHLLPATQETVFPLHVDLWPYLIRRACGASVAAWVGADDRTGREGLN